MARTNTLCNLQFRTTYYYRVAAVSQSRVVGTRSNEASGTPSANDCSNVPSRPAQPPSDNDPSLLVYYDFNSGLADQKRKYGDGRYDLVGADGFQLVSAGSCYSGNRAGYFDSSGGYAYNDNFTSDNETALRDNFTISLWFKADEDMPVYSSLVSSRYVPDTGNDSNIWSFQLDSAKESRSGTMTKPLIRFRVAKGDASGDIGLYTQDNYTKHQWHHLALVKYDNGTATLYLDNVSNSSTFSTSKIGSNTPPWNTLKIGTNRREEYHWKGYIDEFKVYGRAMSAEEVSNLYSYDTPTLFTKSIAFNTSNGYAKQKDATKPLEIDNSTADNCRGLTGSSGSSYVSANSGQPWAIASVFKASAHSSQGSVLSQTAGSDRNNQYRISLEVTDAEELRFWFGNDQNYYKWTSKFTLDSNRWYGFYADYDGCSRSYGNSEELKNFNRFRVWQVDLSTGTATQLTTYNDNDTSTGTWYMSNSAGNPVAGKFYVGSRYQNNDEFQGEIAAVVVTTLKAEGEDLPGASEIGMMVSNPLQWLTDYKVGQNYRKPAETSNRTNFSLGVGNSAASTKVWLMGGGTNDQCDNTNCKFRNQVYSGSADYDLETTGINSDDQQTIVVP